MSPPLQVDGWNVASDDDARALAERGLTGGLGALPSDAGPHDGLMRAWEAVRQTPFADAFARAVVAGLSDAKKRDAALFFLAKVPDAPGADALLQLVQSARAGQVQREDPVGIGSVDEQGGLDDQRTALMGSGNPGREAPGGGKTRDILAIDLIERTPAG